ncbi:sulfatase [Lachnoclostridium sp.]|uniref:sulfatase family protein n=1 Tax=Lachnoclostridium sp. TaxID=2028282 RepID=UPI002897C351|nr:sulfatase [Lachnoclostridium sp.]
MKQNLIYVFADQWRYQALGYHHADQVVTPWMDKFAEESMCFSHAYSTFPLCSPHRASLMSGKYPFSVGMWTNCKIGLEEKIMLKPQETCIGNVLKDNEYQTGYIGKWHLDASELNFHPNPKSGAKDWDAFTPPGERRQGFDYWLSYGASDEHLDPHYWMDSEEQIKPGKWSAEFETDKAIEFLEKRKGQEEPFALFLSYNPPHLPYELVPDQYYDEFRDSEVKYRPNVPEDMREGILKTQSRQYFAAVSGIDEQFGRIYQYLKEQGLEENTMVVLSADHGEMLGSHGLMSKNIWYEESIHIPLMIRQKGYIEAKENPVIFASPDHMPTLLGLMGLEVPVTCQGYNHATGILGEDENAPQDMLLCSYPGVADMVKAFSDLGLSHKAYGWRGVKTATHTYVRSNGYAPGEAVVEYLYDDSKDPYQMNPTVVTNEENDPLVRKMRERLSYYLELTKDPFLMHREK